MQILHTSNKFWKVDELDARASPPKSTTGPQTKRFLL